jgi:hypothetical protein
MEASLTLSFEPAFRETNVFVCERFRSISNTRHGRNHHMSHHNRSARYAYRAVAKEPTSTVVEARRLALLFFPISIVAICAALGFGLATSFAQAMGFDPSILNDALGCMLFASICVPLFMVYVVSVERNAAQHTDEVRAATALAEVSYAIVLTVATWVVICLSLYGISMVDEAANATKEANVPSLTATAIAIPEVELPTESETPEKQSPAKQSDEPAPADSSGWESIDWTTGHIIGLW